MGPRYLYSYDFSGKNSSRLIPDAINPTGVRCSEDQVVYDNRGQVCVLNVVSGEKKVIADNGYRPDISGNRVIWRDRKTLNLHLYDMKDEKLREYGRVGQIFRISGDYLVRRLSGGGIGIENLETGEKKTVDMGRVSNLDVAGGVIVTSSGGEGKRDILMYIISQDKKLVVSDSEYDEYRPATDGKRIAWMSPINEKEFVPLPWSKLTTYTSWNNIYLYDIKTRRKKRIVHNDYMARDIRVAAEKVVWTSGRKKRPESAREHNRNPRDIYVYRD